MRDSSSKRAATRQETRERCRDLLPAHQIWHSPHSLQVTNVLQKASIMHSTHYTGRIPTRMSIANSCMQINGLSDGYGGAAVYPSEEVEEME